MREGNTAIQPLWRDLFSFGIYKRSQGRIARQVTFAVLAAVMGRGAWQLKLALMDQPTSVQFGAFAGVLAIGVWIAYRVVNLPRFADFLIAVEAEMNKVSWPSRAELFRSSLVVIVTMFGLAATLYGYDLVWQMLLTKLGVLRGGG
ncbi:MAG TPA: preprotein translocase subunit SecE [Pirellulales bacterium]|nr:preprotein translocase subunit SecE [Pirellulales bacterium]